MRLCFARMFNKYQFVCECLACFVTMGARERAVLRAATFLVK